MKNFVLVLFLFFLLSCKKDIDYIEGDTLIEVINNYRIEKKLDPIPESGALNIVAEAHIEDLIENYMINDSCNLHSWSDEGMWTGCCYDNSYSNYSCMWDKPRELTDYIGNGYEIAVYTTGDLDAQLALSYWMESEGHHNVIINKDIWKDVTWNAIGAAMKNGYAVVWFGKMPDEGN